MKRRQVEIKVARAFDAMRQREAREAASTHTAEPWVFAYGSIYQGDDANTVEEFTGRIANMDRDNPRTTPCERDQNARRIVACVNACAGMADPATDIVRLRRERAALLEALKTLVETTEVRHEDMAAARAALALCGGKEGA
jgi:hypothetical protein